MRACARARARHRWGCAGCGHRWDEVAAVGVEPIGLGRAEAARGAKAAGDVGEPVTVACPESEVAAAFTALAAAVAAQGPARVYRQELRLV